MEVDSGVGCTGVRRSEPPERHPKHFLLIVAALFSADYKRLMTSRPRHGVLAGRQVGGLSSIGVRRVKNALFNPSNLAHRTARAAVRA